MVIIVVEAEEELGDDDRDGLGDQSTEEEEDALGECSVTGVRAFRLFEGVGIAKSEEAFHNLQKNPWFRVGGIGARSWFGSMKVTPFGRSPRFLDRFLQKFRLPPSGDVHVGTRRPTWLD